MRFSILQSPLQEAGVVSKVQFSSKLFQALSISEMIYLEICVSYFEAVMIISFDEIFFFPFSFLH